MIGFINITLQTPQIVYLFTIERNLTIIRGDGGSGKSYLCEIIEQASQGIDDEGVYSQQIISEVI